MSETTREAPTTEFDALMERVREALAMSTTGPIYQGVGRDCLRTMPSFAAERDQIKAEVEQLRTAIEKIGSLARDAITDRDIEVEATLLEINCVVEGVTYMKELSVLPVNVRGEY